METNNKQLNQIDFDAIIRKIWKNKNIFIITIPIALIIGSIYIFSLPRYYTCKVSLAPEESLGGNMSGSLGSLASSFGFDIASKAISSDAISPELYPNLMKSTDFKISMFPTRVVSSDGKINTTYYNYLDKKQKCTWWAPAIDFLSNLLKKKEATTSFMGTEKINPFKLTKRQAEIANTIEDNIECSIDKKTNVITITIKDQDPLICATIADSTKERLQKYITNYRTKKARNDLRYTEDLYKNAKKDYEKARRKYALSSDADQDVELTSKKLEQEDLENEMQIRFNIYSSLTTQLQAAQAKLRERTPAFTTIECATVPIKPAGPKRMMFLFIIVIITFLGTSLYILKKC
jgi:uncharacterized protein involved in exopolysaccharide biosynthesis